MRRAILGTALLSGVLFAPSPARAQWVVECPGCSQELTTLFAWIKELAGQVEQIYVAYRQVSIAVNTFNAVAGSRNVGSIIMAMNALGIQNPLPVSPYVVQSLISGSGGGNGLAANLAAAYYGLRGSNLVYQPYGNDWQATRMTTTANSLAGIQGLAQVGYQSAADRLRQLAGVPARLEATTDLKETADIQAHLSVAQASTQAQQLQAQYAQTQAMVQPLVRQQRQEEYDRYVVCQHIAYLRGNEDGRAPPPNCVAPAPAGVTAPLYQNASYTGQSIGALPSGSGSGSGTALNAMLATDWGGAAASNATALGVNPEALAATCVIESGCRSVAGSGSVSGAFQMTDSTYRADLAAALAANPSLASQATGGKMDPATQSIAAAQDLRTAAVGLQAAGIQNPTVLDARGAYNFGAQYAVPLATASDDQTMASVLPTYSASVLSANGITPGMTVGAWRQGIVNKLGDSANAPILARST